MSRSGQLVDNELSCKYNQECWIKVRLPLIRKHKIYLPYKCSYVEMGDMEKCSIRDGFIEREKLKEEGVKELDVSTKGTK